MGRTSEPVHGVLLLDKPLGSSSSQVLQRARFALGAAKAGHTGSLDPLASGMLPLCFGEATKIAGLILGARKRYRAEIQLGVVTSTDDAEGEVLAECPPSDEVRERSVQELSRFVGRIRQRPPMFSALKQQGVPLYRRARRGETFEVPEREVEVFAIDSIHCEGTRIECEIECGSGTYIRSIARDLGAALGCGAHLAGLRRLWVDPFAGQAMVTLDEVLEQGIGLRHRLLPIAAALSRFDQVRLDAASSARFRQGQGIGGHGALRHADPVVVADERGEIVGLAVVDERGTLRARRVLADIAAAGSDSGHSLPGAAAEPD